MDKTKKYIEMCEKAQEIQGLKSQHYLGDYIFRDGNVMLVTDFSLSEGGNEYMGSYYIDDEKINQWFSEGLSKTIWLPTQSQLQNIGMLEFEKNSNILLILVVRFNQFCDIIYKESFIDNNTLEQIWMHYIMYLKFNKFWDEDKKEWCNNK